MSSPLQIYIFVFDSWNISMCHLLNKKIKVRLVQVSFGILAILRQGQREMSI